MTCPYKEVRWLREDLQKIRNYVKRLLKREFPGIRGVCRWHFTGEKSSSNWYPHLNILLELQYISRKKFRRLRKLIMRKMKREYGVEVKVINYGYISKGRKDCVKLAVHRWRYVSRPTFLLQNEVKYEEIMGMQNVVWFGDFKDVKDINEMSVGEYLEFVKKLEKIGLLKEEKEKISFGVSHRRCLCGQKLYFARVFFDELMDLMKESRVSRWRCVVGGGIIAWQ